LADPIHDHDNGIDENSPVEISEAPQLRSFHSAEESPIGKLFSLEAAASVSATDDGQAMKFSRMKLATDILWLDLTDLEKCLKS